MGNRPITDLEGSSLSTHILTKGGADTLYAPLGSTGGTPAWGAIIGTLTAQSDLNTALNGKQATIAAGTTSQYYRGDKTWQTLDKSAVALSNVDNTSDVNKPVSTATLTALNTKQPLSTQLTNLAGATWTAGQQVVTLTAANTITLTTVGPAPGSILNRAAADSLYAPIGSVGGGGGSLPTSLDCGASATLFLTPSNLDGGSANTSFAAANVLSGGGA